MDSVKKSQAVAPMAKPTGGMQPDRMKTLKAGTDSPFGSVVEGVKQGGGATVRQYAQPGSVDPKSTIANQLQTYVKDTPLMAREQSLAQDQAISRGLQNSTMGSQAGRAAVLDRAAAFADRDAGVYERQNLANQEAQSQEGLTRLSADLQGGLQELEGKQAERMANLSAKLQGWLQDKEQKYGINLQELQGEQAERLANLEQETKQLVQTSGSVATSMANTMEQISNIMGNKDLTTLQMQAGVNGQIQMLESSLSVLGKIGEVDLSPLLNFAALPGTYAHSRANPEAETGAVTPATPAATTPAPTSSRSSSPNLIPAGTSIKDVFGGSER
jgi:hypothetical protein